MAKIWQLVVTKVIICELPIIRDHDYNFVIMLPYSYKFSRDVYFADATNSAFSRFNFRGSQVFVLVDYVCALL